MKYGLRRTSRWAFLGLAIVPILLAGIGTSLFMWRYHLDTEHERLQQLAQRVAAAMTNEMRRGEISLAALQHYRDLARLGREDQQSLLAEMVVRERTFRSASFVDATGRELARASNVEVVSPGDLSNRVDDEAFRMVMRSARVHYGATRFDKLAGVPLLQVAVPVIDPATDRVAGVLLGELQLRSLWQLLGRLSPGEGTQVYLVDDMQRVIAHANPSVVLRGTRSAASDSARQAQGLMGNWVYRTSHPIHLGARQFRVVAEQDWVVAAKPILGTLAVLAATLAVALIAAAMAAAVVRRRVVMPVLDIEKTARAIADGDLDQRVDVNARGELGMLAQSFNRMTEHLQQTLQRLHQEISFHRQTQRDLQRAQDILRSVIDTVPIAVFWKDRECRYLGCNAVFARDAGQPGPDAVVGKLDAQLAWADDAAQFVADDRYVISSGRPKLAFEEYVTNPDGSLRWVRTSKVPLHDEHQQVIGVLGIYEDITEQKAAREQLRRLNQELEARVEERTADLSRLNKELESFSYSVSHDLRSPLRGIDGFAQVLAEDYAGVLDQTGREHLARIRSAAQRMGMLIDDMLMLSRVSRRSLSFSEVDLSAMCRQILKRLQDAHPQRQVQIRVSDGLMARGDVNLLQIALDNLVGNAWKYTGKNPKAHITFGAEKTPQGTVYFVRDNGVGFEMQYRDKLFKSFERLHSSQDFPGTGVGLATVQRVIQRHGGRIWAEATPGRGATFFFTLGNAPAGAS